LGERHFPLLKGQIRNLQLGVFTFADHTGFPHLTKDILHPFIPPSPYLNGIGRIFLEKRVIIVRPFDTAGNEGTLQERQIFGFLIEKKAGCHSESMPVAADEKLVGIKLENLFLTVLALKPKGVQQFLNFRLNTARFPFEKVLSGLLSDGTAALDYLSRFEVDEHGPDDAGDIQTKMAEELVVLGSNQGIDKSRGDIFVGQVLAVNALKQHPQLRLPISIKNRTFTSEYFVDGGLFELRSRNDRNQVIETSCTNRSGK